jgi:hypothetical protein
MEKVRGFLVFVLMVSFSRSREICSYVGISYAASILTISSAAIDYLDETRKSNEENLTAICHFYFKHDDKERQGGEQVIRELLRQLVYQIDRLPPTLSTTLEELYNKSKTGLPPKQAAIVELFISSSNNFRSTFVFLDGLDECTTETQDKIVILIRRFCESGVRVFLTSQPQLISLVTAVGTFESMEIIADKNDLKTYIKQRFDSPRNNATLEEPLLNQLIEGAEGM